MKKFTEAARGLTKADLVFKQANIVNVFTGTVEKGDLAVTDGIILGIGKYEGAEEIDAEEKYVIPSLIDSHIHIESSMLIPSKFAEAVIPWGVTTVISDPHEIANVMGTDGIYFMINSSKDTPVDFIFMLPSCVPATSFETSGAVINSKDIAELIKKDNFLGLGEMMNYPGVLYNDNEVAAKLNSARGECKIIDGHSPRLSGNDLNAYILSGIKTDHEAADIDEAEEKVRRGMYILIREGTAAKNLKDLIGLAQGDAYRRLLFCSDDLHPYDLLTRGSINYLVKSAIEYGIDPVRAVAIATINAAECYGLKNKGAIAPGMLADLAIVDNLKDFNILSVYKGGKLVAANGKAVYKSKEEKMEYSDTFHCNKIKKSDLKLEIKGKKVNVIGLIPDNILTERLLLDKGELDESIAKICVVERHKNTGNIGLALVKGYGIKGGAVATSIAHDCHNIIAIGDNDEDIVKAVNEIIHIKGGIAISSGRKVIGSLSLPIAGLMTDKSASYVNNKYEELVGRAREMGVGAGVHPFMTLSFLALPVIPHLKLTDMGLFDADKFRFIGIDEE